MNSKILMISSAVFSGISGLTLSFLPKETLIFLSEQQTDFSLVLIQILGAFYFAFAMLNWMARANLIGGIYSRPVAIGNFTHFFIASLVLLKALINKNLPGSLWIVCTFSIIFAVSFGYILFHHPKAKT